MPIRGTNGVFSTGKDIQVILQGDFGQVAIANITGFDSKQVTKAIDVTRLDGIHLSAELPDRWDGTISFERGDAVVDGFFAQREVAWYNTGTYFAATLYTIISETGGSSSWAYDNVALKFDAGSWTGDAAVKCKIEFRANARKQV